RCFREHRRRRGARLADDVVAFEIGARVEMRLGRRRRELVAFDREAEQGDLRVVGNGHDGTKEERGTSLELDSARRKAPHPDPLPQAGRGRGPRAGWEGEGHPSRCGILTECRSIFAPIPAATAIGGSNSTDPSPTLSLMSIPPAGSFPAPS